MSDVSHLLELIRDVPDFPEEGIIFKDITPMLQNAEAFRAAVDMAAEPLMGEGIDVVLGAEARGFVIGAPLAYKIGAGFALVRNRGNSPGRRPGPPMNSNTEQMRSKSTQTPSRPA